MLKVAPHSRARCLHAHSCLFWLVLPWLWELSWLGVGEDHLLCPSLCLLSPSCFPGPLSNYVILTTRAHSWCFTGYEITSTSTHKCWFCLQLLKIRRKALPQVLILSGSCRLPAWDQNLQDCPKPRIRLINYTVFLNVKQRAQSLVSLAVPVTRLPWIMGGITLSAASITPA